MEEEEEEEEAGGGVAGEDDAADIAGTHGDDWAVKSRRRAICCRSVIARRSGMEAGQI